MYKYKSYWFGGTKIAESETIKYFENREDAIAEAKKDWKEAKQKLLDLYGACFEQEQEESGFFGVCDVTKDCEDWWEGTVREDEPTVVLAEQEGPTV